MKFSASFWVILMMTSTIVYGQEVDRISARVTQLAGQNVYLDVGGDQGLAEGDTLLVDSGVSGRRLVIVAVSRKQSIVTFSGKAFPVTRGEELSCIIAKGHKREESEEARGTEVLASSEQPASIMEERTKLERRVKREKRPGIEVDGQLLVNLAALHSETRIRSRAVPPIARTFVTPSVNVNATIRNLPSDMRLHINIRSDYRYQSRSGIGPDHSFRAYRLSLEKPLSFGSLQFGRFYNRMTRRGGYWDGMSFLIGSAKKGFGGSVGFMPERSNEGFTTQFPRFSVFGHIQTSRDKRVFYRGAVTYNQIEPSSVYFEHRYLGVEQRIDWAFVSIRQDLQIDQNPLSKNWQVSHLRVGGRFSLGGIVNVTGAYTLRQPYRMYDISSPFLARRDEYRAGISINAVLYSIGGSYSERFISQEYQGRTFNGYFHTRPVTPLGISFSGSSSFWQSELGDALYANGGVSKSFKKIYIRADYGFYRSMSPNVDTYIDTHRYTLTTSVPFSRRLYWNVRASMQQSQFTDSYSVQTSLQVRF